MGYRSDVHAVFYTHEDNWPLMKLFFDENFPMDELGGCVRGLKNGRLRGYYFLDTNVKWYDSYYEVQAFNVFADKFKEHIYHEENPQPWCYEFVRIGEDDNDLEIDRDGDHEWLLSPERTVRTEFEEVKHEDESDETRS